MCHRSSRLVVRFVALAAVAVAAAAQGGCGTAAPTGKILNVPLKAPRVSGREHEHGRLIYVRPATDRRPDQATIGIDEDARVKFFAADMTVGQYVTEVFRGELREAGFRVASDDSMTDRVVSLEVNDFKMRYSTHLMVIPRYVATLNLSVAVTVGSRTDKKWHWDNVEKESTKSFRGLSPDNCRDAFDEAVQEAVKAVVKEENFKLAVQ